MALLVGDAVTIARDVAADASLAAGGGRLSGWWSAAKLLALGACFLVLAVRRAAPLAWLAAVPIGILAVSGPGVHRELGGAVAADLPGVGRFAALLGVPVSTAGTFLTLAGFTAGSILLAVLVARAVAPPDRIVPAVLVAGMAMLFLAAGGLDLLAALRGSVRIAAIEQAAERLITSALVAALAALIVRLGRGEATTAR